MNQAARASRSLLRGDPQDRSAAPGAAQPCAMCAIAGFSTLLATALLRGLR